MAEAIPLLHPNEDGPRFAVAGDDVVRWKGPRFRAVFPSSIAIWRDRPVTAGFRTG